MQKSTKHDCKFLTTKRKLMSRIPKERMEKGLEQLKTISEEDYAKVKALPPSSNRSEAYFIRRPMTMG
jgi:hypothetical protein